MKIVVMYEDPDEQAAAENLARVLPRIGPSLCNATMDASGISVRSGASTRAIRIRARSCSASEEPAMNALLAAPNATVVIRQDERNLAAVYGTPPASLMREQEWAEAFKAQPGAIWSGTAENPVVSTPNDMPRNTSRGPVRNEYEVNIPDRYQEICRRCGRVKDMRAYCICDPGYEVSDVVFAPPPPQPKPQPKPPRETRDLIFPDEDE